MCACRWECGPSAFALLHNLTHLPSSSVPPALFLSSASPYSSQRITTLRLVLPEVNQRERGSFFLSFPYLLSRLSLTFWCIGSFQVHLTVLQSLFKKSFQDGPVLFFNLFHLNQVLFFCLSWMLVAVQGKDRRQCQHGQC